MHNTDKINLISLIFHSPSYCTWLRSSMWILLAVVFPVIIFFGSSSSWFLLRNITTFRVSLLLGINSTFGFTLTFCVGICTKFLVVLRLHPMFWFVSYFHQDSCHPKFHQSYTHPMVAEVIFLVNLIYYHFLSRLFIST